MVEILNKNLDLMIYSQITSPVTSFYDLWGYMGMMILIADNEKLAFYAGQRYLYNVIQQIRRAAAIGAKAIWIEETLTDQIHPDTFMNLNVPLLKECVQEIHNCGLKSIYYYCGNPMDPGRFDHILDVGADAVHFEESKKNFQIDIEDVVAKVNGRCTVFGNLDSIGILQNGTDEELISEIRRQMKAGRQNEGRFIMSTGSPVTPQTSVERVKRYADIVRDCNDDL